MVFDALIKRNKTNNQDNIQDRISFSRSTINRFNPDDGFLNTLKDSTDVGYGLENLWALKHGCKNVPKVNDILQGLVDQTLIHYGCDTKDFRKNVSDVWRFLLVDWMGLGDDFLGSDFFYLWSCKTSGVVNLFSNVLYLYSMDFFLKRMIKNAEFQQSKSCVDRLGPFVWLLSHSMRFLNKFDTTRETGLEHQITTQRLGLSYRVCALSRIKFEFWKTRVGKEVRLSTISSTCHSIENAKKLSRIDENFLTPDKRQIEGEKEDSDKTKGDLIDKIIEVEEEGTPTPKTPSDQHFDFPARSPMAISPHVQQKRIDMKKKSGCLITFYFENRSYNNIPVCLF
eukprot:UN23005